MTKIVDHVEQIRRPRRLEDRILPLVVGVDLIFVRVDQPCLRVSFKCQRYFQQGVRSKYCFDGNVEKKIARRHACEMITRCGAICCIRGDHDAIVRQQLHQVCCKGDDECLGDRNYELPVG